MSRAHRIVNCVTHFSVETSRSLATQHTWWELMVVKETVHWCELALATVRELSVRRLPAHTCNYQEILVIELEHLKSCANA